jgi:hypothetical protein
MKSILNMLLALMIMTGLMMQSAQAANILYFNDSPGDQDLMGKALETLSGVYSVTTVYDSGKFADTINSGEYQLGIFMVQGRPASEFADGIEALSKFVSSGGLAIYTDWSMSKEYASLFGVEWTGNSNMTQVTVGAPLDYDLKNPIMDLQDPKDREFWSMGLSALKGSTVVADFDKENGAIVIGMLGQTIVNGFLTNTMVDGDQGVKLFQNEINQLLSVPPPGTVPLPGTAVLVGSGLLGLAGLRRKRR